ncbi:MAG: MBL fold metallo-hydrolase [Dehalococcoidia bacterium]
MTWEVLPLHLADVVYPDWHPRFGDVGPVYAFLLRRDGAVLLVDTGLGPAHADIDRHYQPTRYSLADALRKHGATTEEVDGVILTHLHFDHVGNAMQLPSIPLYAQEDELKAAKEAGYTIPEWLAFRRAAFVGIEGDRELRPGLRLIATPGHTPGHQSVAVDTAGGLVVIAGQALETANELRGVLNGQRLEDAVRRTSAARLTALQPAAMLFSHDHERWSS